MKRKSQRQEIRR